VQDSVPPSRKKILIVDDELAIRESLQLILKAHFDVTIAADGAEALEILATVAPDLILLDVSMPKLDGMETLRQMRDRGVSIPVVMLTATTTVRTAVKAIKWGAVDYLTKPFDLEELTHIIASVFDRPDEAAPSSEQGVSPRSQTVSAGCTPVSGFVEGTSGVMRDVMQRVSKVAERDTTVLISGESGVGKELIARQIHLLSNRREGPFVPINCAAIPETLIEAELFGHERGAFTHAIERRIGYCEQAHGGTLFLDEIGELSLAVQVKLLRFLQEREFSRVGSSKQISVDVRIVAATNRNLEEGIRQKTFRQDLFYRINVVHIGVPPLRDRFEDIEPMILHLAEKLSHRYQGKSLVFSREALDLLVQYPWPGNVRELENVVESLLALSRGNEIGVSELPRKIKERWDLGGSPSQATPGLSLEDAERQFERDMIERALQKAGGIQSRAAQILGISRRILKYKMDKLGISDATVRGGVLEGASEESSH
jgi:two-component system response regulator AtoC